MKSGQEPARRFLKTLDEEHVFLAESASVGASVRERIVRLATGRTGRQDATGPESLLTLMSSRYGSFVDDPEAENGRAVVLTPGFCDWSTFFNLNRVAFRPRRKYRLSVRFKAKLTGAPGTVFEVNVFDHKTKTCMARKSWTPKDIRRGYALYDVCDWIPERDQVMHLTQGSFDRSKRGTNPSNAGVWVDYVEIKELK